MKWHAFLFFSIFLPVLDMFSRNLFECNILLSSYKIFDCKHFRCNVKESRFCLFLRGVCFSDNFVASEEVVVGECVVWKHPPPWYLQNCRRYDYEIFTTCSYSYGGTKSKNVSTYLALSVKITDQIPENPDFWQSNF